jgi:hypothetical protein
MATVFPGDKKFSLAFFSIMFRAVIAVEKFPIEQLDTNHSKDQEKEHVHDEDLKHNAEECQGEFFVAGEHSSHVPIVEAREWGVKAFNYDNCGIAMITLFAVQTTEGWVDVLQDSMSSTYEDEGPIPMFRVEMAIFYIVYFVVFPFFFVNIFVALVIVTFNELGEAELTGDIDKNQKSCTDQTPNKN